MDNKIITIKDYLNGDSVKNRIQELLKDRTQQFIITVSAMVNQNEALAKCEPASLVQAALTATAMDLPVNPNLGFVHIIPYNDRKNNRTVAQLQFGYKSFIQLGLRSGQFKKIEYVTVHEDDTDETVLKRLTSIFAKERPKGKVIGYAAYFQLLNGFEKTLFMTVDELQKHGKQYSQTYKKGFGLWEENFEAMAIKTVLKLLLSRFAPLSVEMQKAVLTDQGIINDLEGEKVEYIDNKPETTAEVVETKDQDRILKSIDKAKTSDDLASIYEDLQGLELSEEHPLAIAYTNKKKEIEK